MCSDIGETSKCCAMYSIVGALFQVSVVQNKAFFVTVSTSIAQRIRSISYCRADCAVYYGLWKQVLNEKGEIIEKGQQTKCLFVSSLFVSREGMTSLQRSRAVPYILSLDRLVKLTQSSLFTLTHSSYGLVYC